MTQKVVAHYIDHAIVKGTSLDVDAGRPVCHVRTADGNVEVDLRQLKALFFVKDLTGEPTYNDEQVPRAGDVRLRGSHQVRIRFADGEQIGGLTNRYPPNRPFFFLLPMDQKSNNVRVLVNRDAVTAMEEIRHSEQPSSPVRQAPLRPGRKSWVFDGTDIKQVRPER
jgi:hypothetical protein